MALILRLQDGKTIRLHDPASGALLAEIKCRRKKRVAADRRSKATWELVITDPNDANQVDQKQPSH